MNKDRAPVLDIKNLSKHYGKSRGIDDINLGIMPGEVFGFIGPNGAGKSTTINTILDNLRASSGSVTIFGLDSRRDSQEIHRRIGYLAGDMETDPSLTGAQYLRFVANLRGGVKHETIDALVTRLRCETNKKIRHLSRGNKQKIGLIAALMHDPDLLILDEPTSGLDPLIQAEFNAIINERKDRGKTTFMSSHVLSEVQESCDRVGFIRDGKLIMVSAVSDLFRNTPRNITVTFPKAPNKTILHELKGTKNMQVDGATVSFLYDGDINQAVRAIARYPLSDLTITEPALEDLFMNYYKVQEKTDV